MRLTTAQSVGMSVNQYFYFGMNSIAMIRQPIIPGCYAKNTLFYLLQVTRLERPNLAINVMPLYSFLTIID